MTTVPDPIPPDTRSIDEMPFGSGAADQQTVATRVRETLRRCGVTVAHEIEELGCTGASAKGLKASEIAELRLGLGGGGVGLPCFVPPTRYCLAHSTIGGLQIGQLGRFPEEISKISRELMPRERGQMKLTEEARRVRGDSMHDQIMHTADALSGHELPPGVEMGDETDTGFEDAYPYRQVAEQATRSVRSTTVTEVGPGVAFVCPEHAEPVWSCRYCIAQMIVEGPLAPSYVVRRHDEIPVEVTDVEASLDDATRKGALTIEIYVRAATFSRKLARD